ncbi:MAG: ABC transporter substrate-binding protein [Variovorax paradoxus]|nr:MAG: ABC transporter substrate-binding protein [Variovorax paradoxus]PZQ00158.1 MAG: ABC transporter substrate-binding protein [Variovorax paradoxus]
MEPHPRRIGHWFRASLVVFALFCTALVHAASVLKVVTQSDLKVIDPVMFPAYIVRNHGLMVYDVLFATDANGAIKPQMVDTWSVSPDQLTWTFKLRPGLKFHDGKPVTAADVVASLKRWAGRDNAGKRMMDAAAEVKAADASTFVLRMKAPYGLVLETLGKPGSPAFIMPERIAATPSDQPIKDATGSGPFIFQPQEWRPGVRVVYLRNPDYKPRAEPPSGLAGGKVAKVDRVEWVSMPDAQTAANALMAGEVDLIEAPPADLLPMLKSNKNVGLFAWDRLGTQYWMVFNHLQPPFNDARVRRAAMLAIEQEDIMMAQVGDPERYTICSSPLVCGTPYAKDFGKLGAKADVAQARKLLKEARYDGTPIAVMSAADFPTLSQVGPVVEQQLQAVGFKVNLLTMDWQSIQSRRTRKDPVAQGGWNMFFTRTAAVDVMNPLFHPGASGACERAYFGWPCDPEMEALRERFATTTDKAAQLKVAQEIQDRMVSQGFYGWLGEVKQVGAFRAGHVSGWVASPALVLWNIEKK